MTRQAILRVLRPTHRLIHDGGRGQGKQVTIPLCSPGLTASRDCSPPINEPALGQANKALPTFAYGSVWLVAIGDNAASHLSRLGLYALSTADAVIHDTGVPERILDLVKPPRYREAADAQRAVQRAIKLAQDGWRVVHLVKGEAAGRAADGAAAFAQNDIPFRIVSDAVGPSEEQLLRAVMVVHDPLSTGCVDRRSAPVELIPVPALEAEIAAQQRQPPVTFWMSGLAG